MKAFVLFIGLICVGFVSFGQDNLAEEATTIQAVSDTLKKTVPFDTTRGKRFQTASKNFLSTVKKVVGIDTLTKRDRPRIIFLRSMLVPGTGQIMNKDYWKVPLVYGGAAVGVGVIVSNNRKYQEYIHIVMDMNEKKEKSRPYVEGGPEISINTYARAAANFRRYRDFSYIGMGLGWTLFAVEANVSAHLKNFDISDNISMKIQPTVMSLAGTYNPGVKFRLNFN